MLLLALALLQTDVLPRPLNVPLNPLLVGVVCWAVLGHSDLASLWAFYGGIWLDLLNGGPVGMHSLTLLLAVALATGIVRAFDQENWLLPLGVILGGTLLFHLTQVLSIGGAGTWGEYALMVLLPALLWNAILALPEYMLLRWWSRRWQPRLEW